ncbi:MAG: hypothetical protein OEM46_10670 [Ignavibacteria bacterium]|nr:hypothetical protein [Ignavibacteria bacterium]
MKTILQILFFVLLFLITAFPQNKIHRGVIPEKPTGERLLEMHQSNADGLQGLNDRESLLLKSNSSNWQTALRNQLIILKKFYLSN